LTPANHAGRQRGFTLTELAVVFMIISLLLGTAMYTLSAQTEQRNSEETRRRLEAARELLFSFAIVNGRLPCPARSTSAGDEVRVADSDAVVANRGKCQDAVPVEDYYGGVVSAGPPPVTGGFLPARAIGYQVVDASGFALDGYGNRIRYAVEKFVVDCAGPSTLPHFTYAPNMRANGITCLPRDLLLCKSATGVNGTPNATSCGAATNVLTNQKVVVAVVYSVGKNGATGSASADEAANVNGDPVFVWHAPTPAGAAGGEFDDQMTWITAGELYAKLIAAGLLP
jgi:prepilin-type N-terminal cleavage/methylation domain-containing protein